MYSSTIRPTLKRSMAVVRITARSSADSPFDGGHCAGNIGDEEARRPLVDQLGHGAAGKRDHRRAARHGLDDAVAERLVEVDQVEQRGGATEER